MHHDTVSVSRPGPAQNGDRSGAIDAETHRDGGDADHDLVLGRLIPGRRMLDWRQLRTNHPPGDP
jgi:hypothetical protein